MSVVIPTFQRRELVIGAVEALARQEDAPPFEVIVTVDGSTDGSADALTALAPVVRPLVVTQPNRGAAAARNLGAARARGEVLLFLDDDMEADPRLLAEHDASHRAGAAVVIGHIPLHPASRGFLSAAVGEWADGRCVRLDAPGAVIVPSDVLTGQLSIDAALFRDLGGFDEMFTAGGTFGDEDLDLGQRVLDGGHAVVFNPRAVSRQRYVVTPRQHLRQYREAGRADVAFARKHPHRADEVFRAGAGSRRGRAGRALLRLPGAGDAVAATLRAPAVAVAEHAPYRPGLLRFFKLSQRAEYWRGVREAGGVPGPHPVRVLSFHSASDLSADPVLAPYGLPPRELRRLLVDLRLAGCTFVTPTEFLAWLRDGAGLPERPVLVTFDDAYADFATGAMPVLRELGVTPVVFVVSGAIGGVNHWDSGLGRTVLPLLGAQELAALAAEGVEVGAHSRSHLRLPRCGDAAIHHEVAGALDDLVAAGLPRPRLYAYPYGEHDARVRAAAARSGVEAAFTVAGGAAIPDDDPMALPRVEVTRGRWPRAGLIRTVLAARRPAHAQPRARTP